MLKNFLLTAFRNIVRQKLYSILNIVGLSTGITASLLLLLYVSDELSYDTMFTQSNNIYRVNTFVSVGDTDLNSGVTMSPLGPALKNDYPDIKSYTRLAPLSRPLVSRGERRFYEEDFYYVDSTFFELFDFKIKSGNPSNALVAPKSIVLSESLAQKYFGDEDPVGQTIKTGKQDELMTVTAVMQDPYSNSHIRPNALISYSSLSDERTKQWGNIDDVLYILLPEGYDPERMERNFSGIYEKYLKESYEAFNAYARFSLIPLEDIHLKSTYEIELEPPGSIEFVYVFSAIAFLILLIACINYMNLATAKGASRSKEVGIRKVMGSYRSQLQWQFIMESMLITAFSAFLCLILVVSLIPVFNEISGKSIPVDSFLQGDVIGVFLLIIFAVGTVSGSYPALYLSDFKPVEVLKGKSTTKSGNPQLRKWLVIFQFTISLVMIICTSVIYNQLEFVANKDLGFKKDQLLKVELNDRSIRDKYPVWKQLLEKSPGVISVGTGESTPGGSDLSMRGTSVETNEGDKVEKVYRTIRVDQDYLETIGIPLILGRDFLPSVGLDTSESVIVNESLVRDLGWSEPLGKRFYALTGNGPDDVKITKVVGVVKDFHLRSLQEPIEPLFFEMRLNNDNIIIRTKVNDIETTIAHIENTWIEVFPNRPFQYSFVSQDFEELYLEERRKGRLFAIFGGLTILIACLGLFGLASYNSELRRKEIGVRKVMGASLKDIIVLMSKDFVKLILVAVIIAFPVSWYYMNEWLDEFSYRIDMHVYDYLFPTIVTAAITLLTIAYHSIKSALSNPAVSLKEE